MYKKKNDTPYKPLVMTKAQNMAETSLCVAGL